MNYIKLYQILIHVCIPEAGGTFGITWRWIQCLPVTLVCGGIASRSFSCKLNFSLFLLANFHPFFLFSSFLSSCLFHCKNVNVSRSPHAGRVCRDELESIKEKIKVGKRMIIKISLSEEKKSGFVQSADKDTAAKRSKQTVSYILWKDFCSNAAGEGVSF